MRQSLYGREYIRARAEDLMEDQCRIFRPGPTQLVYDPETRRATHSPTTTIYLGKCRVWEVPAGGQFVLGEVEYTTSQLWMSIPHNAPIPNQDDQVEILESVDGSLQGKFLKITSIVRGGNLRSSRRMHVDFVDRKDVRT